MTPPPSLKVRLSAVTPAFLGGAEPNQRAELRSASFKGLLRYWYRALDGEYRSTMAGQGPSWEQHFFGSTETGQSPCLLRIRPWSEGDARWERSRYVRPLGSGAGQGGFQRGTGRQGENGIQYLGYSLTLGGNDRKAIFPHGGSFGLRALLRPGWDSAEVRRAWTAALWLLVHIGGVGTRSRRGLGSLRIEAWDGWDEPPELPLPCKAATPDEWQNRMNQGLRMLRSWFPVESTDEHTALTSACRYVILNTGYETWEEALDEAGLRFQRFRRGHPLPERSGFGLPLTGFNLPGIKRLASPLFLRVVKLQPTSGRPRYHSAFIHLPTPLPHPATGTWPPGADTVVDTFLTHVSGAQRRTRR